MKNTIYIIHGWTYSITPWTSTVSVLRSRGYGVVQLRVPGLTAASDRVWTIEDYVEWLRGELKDVKKPIVLGHSNGGRIALNYLAKYPGSFSRLILLNSAGVYDDQAGTSLKRMLFWLLSKLFSPLKRSRFLRRVVYHFIGAQDYNVAPENMKKTLANMIESDKLIKLANYGNVKTNILWGGSDDATPLWQGRQMHRSIKPSTFKVVKLWRHAPYITDPYGLANELTQILRGDEK